MCEPTSIAYGIAAIAGGLYVNNQVKKAQQAGAQAPAAATAPPAPDVVSTPVAKAATPVQATKTPSVQSLKAANTTTVKNGQTATATMLTGTSGVSLNPADVSRNTLLGS